jgi:hypothetical protein
VVDLRIYRVGFVAAVLTVLVAMFSLQERPAPLGSPIPPDAFKGDLAYGDTARFVKDYPDRAPGGAGDEGLGSFVEGRFRALGLETSRASFTGTHDGEDVHMSNVIGLLNAPSDRQIVVMAPRDAEGRPGASSASSTATLLQLAQALAGSSRKRTFVFVSLDGSAAGNAGAERFAATYPARDKVDAVLAIDEPGAASPRRPYVIPWASSARRGALQVLRTAEAALARESGEAPRSDSWAAQFLRQAWPLTLREQGPLVAHGLDAVTLTSRGEVPRGGGPDGLTGISSERLQTFGRAAFSTALAYDSAPQIKQSPERYIAAGHKVLPGWAIALLVVGLTTPALLASFDAFARARRQRIVGAPSMRRIAVSAAPFAVAFGVALLFEVFGWLPDSAAEALAPATRPTTGAAAAPLLVLLFAFACAWVFLRSARARRVEDLGPAGPGPAVAVALTLAIEVLLVCIADPFTALLLVPAAHLAVLAALPEPPPRRLVACGFVATALALPVLALIYYGGHLHLGGDLSGYALLLVEPATRSVWSALLVSIVAGTLLSGAAAARARARLQEAEASVTVRGPATYAGPGSLGGTESALRR